MAKPLSVEIWSDIACPWCYVGKRRFEQALARFPHAAEVNVTFRAFELDPSAPPVRDASQSYAQRIGQKYGTSAEQAQAMIDRMVATAAEVGIAMDFRRIRPGNTFDAHRLLQLAQARGSQEALIERLMTGYFGEGAAIGDSETLRRLALEAGLDADEVSGVLGSDLYAAEVRAEESEARQLGITGVPFFLLGRRYGVSGAQPAELLQEALQKAWDE